MGWAGQARYGGTARPLAYRAGPPLPSPFPHPVAAVPVAPHRVAPDRLPSHPVAGAPRSAPARRYRSAARIIFSATGAARPLPLTSERAAPESWITTATATRFPLAGSCA